MERCGGWYEAFGPRSCMNLSMEPKSNIAMTFRVRIKNNYYKNIVKHQETTKFAV